MKLLINLLVCLPILTHGQIDLAIDVPIDQLPKKFLSPNGQISLIADFDADRSGGIIPVYFVNRSNHDIKLTAQDGDVYLKLESLSDKGDWERAQPHVFSWCGNSYDFSPVVRKDHFLRIDGFQPTGGRKAKIRYRLYLQKGLDLVTLPGDGLCLDSDIQAASVDALALTAGTFELVASIARGTRKAPDAGKESRDPQPEAIYQLGSERFPADRVISVLDEIDAKFPKYKDLTTDVRRKVSQRK